MKLVDLYTPEPEPVKAEVKPKGDLSALTAAMVRRRPSAKKLAPITAKAAARLARK